MQSLHHLHQLDVEGHIASSALGERGDGSLDPLDRARVVRTPDVDQRIGVLGLLEVIGEIGAEVGPRAVGFLDRQFVQ